MGGLFQDLMSGLSVGLDGDVGGMVKNMAHGVSDTASKLTSNASTVLTYMSADETFRADRDRHRAARCVLRVTVSTYKSEECTYSTAGCVIVTYNTSNSRCGTANNTAKGGGGGGFRSTTLEKRFRVGEEGQETRPDILRVVLGPCVQYCPREASKRKLKFELKEIELSYCHDLIFL